MHDVPVVCEAASDRLGDWQGVGRVVSCGIMKTRTLLLIGIVTGLWTMGCETPPKAEGPTQAIISFSTPGASDAFIDESLTLLREHDFQPKYVERELGLIQTEPSTGGQWFEIWRSDVHGGYQIWESSLATIRRVITVQLTPRALAERMAAGDMDDRAAAMRKPGATASDQDYMLDVQVDVSRYSAPERQVTTASGALAIYSERLPTEEGLRASRVRGEHWVPLRRDVLLERYFLGRLEELVGAADFVAQTRPEPSAPATPPAIQPASRPTNGQVEVIEASSN